MRRLIVAAASLLAAPAFAQTLPAPKLSSVRLGPATTNTTPAVRAPLFIFNDYNPTSSPVAGYNPGCQIWIGNNPTATPGSGDAVGCTWSIDNLNSRSQLWNGNFVANHVAAGLGGAGGAMRNLELEIIESYSFNSDPFSGSPRSNGIEQVVSAGSTFNATAARMTWANDTTGVGWWYNGDVYSRVTDTGIKFVVNPGGVTDTGTAFQTAAIADYSNSANVLKVTGSHVNLIDLSGVTAVGTFLRGPSGTATNVGVANLADFNAVWHIDSGKLAGQQSILALKDRGTEKWWVYKAANNAFGIFDTATVTTVMAIAPATDAVTFSGSVGAASFKAGASAGVSCTAGSVSTATMVITAGIVTHC